MWLSAVLLGKPRDSTTPDKSPSELKLALPDKPSIAVLPFKNLSSDPQQEYFAEGIVEDIITGLARIKWLFVIARNSSFAYREPVDVRRVGRELGVRYVLEGSVRKAGDRVRISIELVEAETGIHLWADRCDRKIEDIFAVQDEITLGVVGAIEPSLRDVEIERVKRKRPDNLDAYDLVLRAMPLVYAVNPEEAAKALLLLERVTVLETNYGIAHGFLAWCHVILFLRAGFKEDNRTAAIRPDSVVRLSAFAAIAGGLGTRKDHSQRPHQGHPAVRSQNSPDCQSDRPGSCRSYGEIGSGGKAPLLLPPGDGCRNILWSTVALAVCEARGPQLEPSEQNNLFEYFTNPLEICYSIRYL
jgi:TolB-like protein